MLAGDVVLPLNTTAATATAQVGIILSPTPSVSGLSCNSNLAPTTTFLAPINVNVNLSGTQTVGFSSVYQFSVAPDNLDSSAVGSTIMMFVIDTFGTGLRGGRVALEGYINVASTTGNGPGTFYVATVGWANASQPDAGNLFGGNFLGILLNGATGYAEVCGSEVDVLVQTGASVGYKHGLTISLGIIGVDDQVAGTLENIGLRFVATTTGSPGWTSGISFGSGEAYWPINSAGTIIGTTAPLTT